jgi:RNA polymerase sigma-70 factor (ECF subfamily)
MTEESSFADLVARLRTGDQTAAALVVEHYAHRLVALARSHLDRRILPKEDAEDVLQSVFKSFFHRCRGGQFRLDRREDLWALLVTLTLHKCGHHADHFWAARRDVRREVVSPADASGSAWERYAREPTPEEAALLTETVERLLDGLEAHQRAIVTLTLEGATVAQVAARLNTTQRTVQRVLRGVRERLERWQTEADPA